MIRMTQNGNILQIRATPSSTSSTLSPQAPSLSDLPNEVLELIIAQVYASSGSQVDLIDHLHWFARTVSLVNRKFYRLSARYSYRYFIFKDPQSFHLLNRAFTNNTTAVKSNASKYIKTLDLQEFTLDHLWDGQVESSAFLSFLQNAKNLKEVLFSFALDYTLDEKVIEHLFYASSTIESIDLSGLTSVNSDMFAKVVVNRLGNIVGGAGNDANGNFNCSNLKALSFHGSEAIPASFFNTLFPHLTNIEKLDLASIQISDDSVASFPVFHNLTHLSLSCCKLDKHRIFDYFTNQRALQHTLKWLNLETDYYHNTLTEDEILMVLDSLVPVATTSTNTSALETTNNNSNSQNTTLQYLNLNGRSVTFRILSFIKQHFISLQALHCYKAPVSVSELIRFLTPPCADGDDKNNDGSIMSDNDNESIFSVTSTSTASPTAGKYQKLKYINVAGNRDVTIEALTGKNDGSCSLLEASPSMLCWELSPFVVNRLPNGGEVAIPAQEVNSTTATANVRESSLWRGAKCQYRAWLYKVDNHDNNNDGNHNSGNNFNSGVRMKTSKGSELINHPFVKFAYNKIEVSNGHSSSIGNMNDDDSGSANNQQSTWPVRLSEHSIYNEYALNTSIEF